MRGEGFNGKEAITLQSVKAYIDLFGRPSMDLDIFMRLIAQMDRAYRAAKQT